MFSATSNKKIENNLVYNVASVAIVAKLQCHIIASPLLQICNATSIALLLTIIVDL
jgi:hypothetical protein